MSYTESMQLCAAVFPTYLSSAELRVLSFIIQRTHRWGKESECIPKRHFLEGVFDEFGKPICCAASGDPQSLYTALRGLQDKGLITVSCTAKTNRYYCTYDNLRIVGARYMDMLKEARQKKDRAKSPLKQKKSIWLGTQPPSGRDSNHMSGREPNHISKRSKVIDSEVTHGGPPSARDAVSRGVEKNKRALSKRAKATAFKKTKSATEALWKELVPRLYPEVKWVPSKMSSSAWGKIKNVISAMSPEEYREFLVWYFETWPAVRTSDLSWADNAKAIPEYEAFASLAPHLVNVRASHQATNRAGKASQRPQERSSKKTDPDLAARLRDAERALQEAQERERRGERQSAEQARQLADARRALQSLAKSRSNESGSDLPDWEEVRGDE